MGSGFDRANLGVVVEKSVLDQGGSRDDIVLVMNERPDVIQGWGVQVIETAKAVRQDKDCFALKTDELTIEIPALPRPTLAEIQEKRPWIKSIERDDSPTEAVTLRLATVLKSTESSITGSVYERRLIPQRGITLGYQHWQWFLKNQNQLPEPAKSEARRLLGKVYIDFPGIIVVCDDGIRDVPFALQFGKSWDDYWDCLDFAFDSGGRIAVSSK